MTKENQMDDLMPPLPEPVMRTTLPFYDGRDQFYTADQMREYAKKAVEADRKRIIAANAPEIAKINDALAHR